MSKRWRRLDLDALLKDVPEGTATEHGSIQWAKQLAAQADVPVFPGLPYTESDVRLVLLYEHVQRGQLQPRVLRRMRRDDLEYIAGHPAPHPELIEAVGTPEQIAGARGRAIKIVENVVRAGRELQRRSDSSRLHRVYCDRCADRHGDRRVHRGMAQLVNRRLWDLP